MTLCKDTSGKRSTGFRLWQGGATAAGLALACLLLGLPSGAALPADADNIQGAPRWPVRTDPHAITGTFMESRGTRFHSGMDIRTEGRTGLAVRAPVAGEIRRIRCSTRGYGLALYLRLDDGRQLVFAHLDRFLARAADRLREAQSRTRRYEQDLAIGPGEIRVEAGAVLALSGQTGTGAPHLHFELRDADQRPMNPADFLEVPDRVAPEVQALRLVPVEPEAGPGLELRDGQEAAARGRWRMQARVVDRTGYAPFPVAPRAVELRVDGVVTYGLENSVFAFGQTRQVALDQFRDPEGRWYRLYRREGMDLPGREGGLGTVEVGDREVRVEIVARDSAGLADTLRCVLKPSPAVLPVERTGLRMEEFVFIAEVATADDAEGVVPVLAGPEGAWPLGLAPGGWRLVLAHAGMADGEYRLLVGGESLGSIHWIFPSGGCAAVSLEPSPLWQGPADEDDFYPGGMFSIRPVPVEPPRGLIVRGQGLELASAGLVLHRGLRVFVPGPAEAGSALMFRAAGAGGSWSALAAVDEGRLAGEMPVDGVVAWMVDRESPVIGAPGGRFKGDEILVRERVDREVEGVPLPRWQAFDLPVRDEGTGIAPPGPEVWLDDLRWPVRYDDERHRLILDWFVEPAPGRYSLRVRVTDLVGNMTQRQWPIEFLPGNGVH